MKKLLILILCVCGLTAYAQEQQGPFRFEPSVVLVGQPVTFLLVSAGTSNKISKCQKREIKPLYNN